MKKILFPIIADIFVPFYFQLSRYLESCGYRPYILTFLPREHVFLKKNRVDVLPQDIFIIKEYGIRPNLFSPEEMDDILKFFIIKIGGKRKDWEDRLLRVASYIHDVLDQYRFDAVMVWNGDDYIGKALAILAKRKGIPVVFVENGYFPKTLQFDRQGVNINSSITHMPFADISNKVANAKVEKANNVAFQLKELKNLDWKDYARGFLVRKLNPFYYKYFPELRGNSWFKEKWLKFKRSRLPFNTNVIPEKFIFIPFQVHDDTQILLNSKFFKNMESFFEFSYAAIKRNFGDEYKIVVKEHPEDLCRYSYSKLYSKYPDVIWLKKYNIDTLIKDAAYVFVVNSSVGLQAVERFKPTIVFGESFYSRDEIVFFVKDINLVDNVIKDAKNGMTPIRMDRIGVFISFLKGMYFTNGGWKDITANGIVNAGNKIIFLLNDK